MQSTHSVGIDLGTTYSCISYLNEQGEPVTLPNAEGELATPSVVLFEGERAVVGTPALRNAIRYPEKVVQNSKRFMGHSTKVWRINGRPYTPVDIATIILKKLLSDAQKQIGPIEQAVITVPAQFSDAQRHATVEAGHRAGLKRVDIINEPVAAALCYVLGTEGLWFTELADEQRILVYDLGGGTFDLSLVRYQKDEVSVIASSGDLNLGGIDWNQALMRFVAKQFQNEFGLDVWGDLEAVQALANEAEQTKRSLSVRPKAAMACRLDEKRKIYQITVEQFEELTRDLVERTAEITRRMLKDHQMGWAHVDVVLTTGGASRMPMIRRRLKELSGTTLNTSLSPDLSIAHGATYYAGMLLTNDKFARSILTQKAARRLASIRQRSVNARALGILARDPRTGERRPHYILPANTPLPADVTNTYGTVVPNQRRVHLQIVESGIAPGDPYVKIGDCIIDDLPAHLPEGSEIAVTISYDAEARVHVSAKDVASGARAQTEIVRQDNVVPQLAADHLETEKRDGLQLLHKDVELQPLSSPAGISSEKTPPGKTPPGKTPPGKTPPGKTPTGKSASLPREAASASSAEAGEHRPSAGPVRQTVPLQKPTAAKRSPAPKIRPRPLPQPGKAAVQQAKRSLLERADQPIPLCNKCGEPLTVKGECPQCPPSAGKPSASGTKKPVRKTVAVSPKPGAHPQRAARSSRTPSASRPVPPVLDDEILELDQTASAEKPRPVRKTVSSPQQGRPRVAPPSAGGTRPPSPAPPVPPSAEEGEDEFWELVDE